MSRVEEENSWFGVAYKFVGLLNCYNCFMSFLG
ncbi:hypothetical protein LINPERHAP2_LOCUS33132 [Linum perenne]